MTEKNVKDLVFESHCMLAEQGTHLRWICETLKEMKEQANGLDDRLRSLERWRAEHTGKERRLAGAGGIAGAALGTLAGSVFSLLDLIR